MPFATGRSSHGLRRPEQEGREAQERQPGKKLQSSLQQKDTHAPAKGKPPAAQSPETLAFQAKQRSRDEKKKADADSRKRSREVQARQARIESLETRIAQTESAIRDVEQQMSAPGFYEDRAAAQPVIDRHQALMWQVGDLMHQWEELQSLSDLSTEA